MGNPLTGKVGLDITDYKAAVAEMNRSIRVIESGFRASAAALGDWSNDASGLELRMRALTGQIEIQQQKVAALQAEYERVAAEKGETSRAAQDLEIKLNKEKETLGKMQTELSGTEAALEEMTGGEEEAGEGAEELAESQEEAAEATESFSDKLKGLKDRLVGAIGGLKEMGGKVLSGLKTGLLAVGTAVTGAVVGLGALVLKSAATADDLVELSEKTGISVERLQELQFIGDQTGTSLDTVTSSLAKMTRNMDAAREGTGAAHDAFESLGVPVTDVNGELRDSEEVFGEVIDALGRIENPTERDALAMEIFGKSAQELNPLLNAGSEGLEEMAEQAHGLGAVMGEEAVTGLADLNDMVAGLKAGFQGFLGTLASAFLPVFRQVVGAVQGFLADPNVQAGLQNIVQRVSEFAGVLATAVEQLLAGDVQGALSAMFPPEVVEQIFTIATQFKAFVDQIIVFVTEHAEAIKGAFIAIGVALAGAGIVAALAAIINPINLIIAAVALLGAAWAEDWGGIRTSLTAWWEETGKPIFEQLKEWLAVNLPLAIEVLKSFWVDVLQPAIEEVWGWMKESLFPLLADLVEIYFKNIGTEIEVLKSFWVNTLLPAIQDVWGWISGTLFPLFVELANWLGPVLGEAVQGLSDFWTGTLQPALQGVWDFISGSLFPLFTAFADFLVAVFQANLTGLAWEWENVLQPALEAVWGFLKDDLWPIFQDVGAWLSETFGPIIETIVNGGLANLQSAFLAIKDAINWLIERFTALSNKLSNFSLPPLLTPGSPTPFELGLRGIGEAMDELARKRLVELEAGFDRLNGPTPGPSPFGEKASQNGEGGGGGTTVNHHYYLTANYPQQSQRSLMAEVRLRELMAR